MSKAEDLLNSLTEEVEERTVTTVSSNEPHIVIGLDRFITVPDQIKKIGVQYDHDIETVTFDCPRFWDSNDLSAMKIYINYMREDGHVGMHLCDIVSIEDDIMHFDWTISGEVTQIKGTISFLVCIKKVDSDGNEERHWNSELCQDLYVSEGMECQESILYRYPDIITQLLTRMDITESNTSKEEILNRINEALDTNDTINQTIKDKTVDYLESEITSKDLIVELPVGEWTKQYDNEYTQTVVIDGVDASINPIVSLFYSGEEATDDELNAYTCLSEVTTLDNAIKFVAIEKPSITFSVIVKGLTGVLLSDSIRLLISDKWSANKKYKHGDYCIYNDTLWRCDCAVYNTVIGEAPSDTSTTWSKVSVSDILKNLSFASNILSSLTSNDFDYSGGPIQIGAPPYTVNESLSKIKDVLRELNSNFTWKSFDIELFSTIREGTAAGIQDDRLKGCKEIRLFDNANDVWTEVIPNINLTDKLNGINYTNGLGVNDGLFYAQRIKVNFGTGEILNITMRDLNQDVNKPKFTKVIYR